MTPLESLSTWIARQDELVRSWIYFGIRTRYLDQDLLMGDSDEMVQEWMGDKLDYFQHIGRVLQCRSVVDYIFHTKGDESHWEKELDKTLEALEREGTPIHLKPVMNETIAGQDSAKPIWLKSANDWKIYRVENLSDQHFHEWEEAMLIRSATGQDPQA